MSADRIHQLDLNLLFVMDALLKHGSASQAAVQLGVTQSAVSHALKRLRRFFGDPLFVRGRHGMVPTARAQSLAAAVSQITTLAHDQLLNQAAFDPTNSRRIIRIGVNDMGEFATLPQLVRLVRSQAPGCSIRTEPVERRRVESCLENGEVDIVLAGPLALSDDIVQQRLYMARFAVIAGTGARLAEPLSLADYAATDQVVVHPGDADRLPLDPALKALGMQRRPYVETPHSLTIPAVIEEDETLISTVPLHLANYFVRKGGVRIVETAFDLPSFPVYQYWHRRFHGDLFSLWLRSALRSLSAERQERPE